MRNTNNIFSQNLIILLLVVSISSCVNKTQPIQETYVNNNGLLVLKQYHKNGKLKSEQFFALDTIQQGESLRFYENGNVETRVNFFNGEKNGMEETYYQNGNRKYIGFYKNGKQDSLWTWYSAENKIESKGYWQDNKAFKEHLKYYADGIHVKEYLYYDLNGNLLYKNNYTNDGKLVKEEGNYIPMIIADKYSLKIGEIFVGKIYVVNPPHFKSTKVMSKIIGVSTNNQNLTKKNDYYLYEEKVIKKGKYKWQIMTQFYAKDNEEPIEIDRSTSIEVN